MTLLPLRDGFDVGNFINQAASVRDTVLAEPQERIWTALPNVFRTLGVEVTTLSPSTYAMGNESWRGRALHGTRLSSFLECGTGILGPNADAYDVTMVLMMQAVSRGASSTQVRVMMDANARPRNAAGIAVRCTSRGTLEVRILRLLDEALSRGEGLLASRARLGRLPSAGDWVRMGCATSPSLPAPVVEGSFVGASGGEVLLETGPDGRRSVVPVPGVTSVQIREERSRGAIGAIALGIVGSVAGGHVGRQRYDPEGLSHYGPDAFTAIGVVAGLIVGALVGAIGGSLFDYDEWIDVTPNWHARFGGGTASAAPVPEGVACPGFRLEG